jgi:hypothetical protein
MGRNNSIGKLQKKVKVSRPKRFNPEVYIDHESDNASIKIAPGIEAKSYSKDGLIFCEDKDGKIIEVQVLNLSELAKKKTAA